MSASSTSYPLFSGASNKEQIDIFACFTCRLRPTTVNLSSWRLDGFLEPGVRQRCVQ